jgi:regulator of RNase E activity RraA
MTDALPSAVELALLATFDTPTICNALELLRPEARAHGYTTRACICGFPHMKPVVGFARTATMRSKVPPAAAPAEVRRLRDDYYRYVEAGPKPSLVVIKDLDGLDAGHGAFWGEVQSAIHKGLGARGVITDGSVRDIDQWAPDFQFLAAGIAPSHAYANIVAIGREIEVFGMRVHSGDIVHADRHGAVVVPVAAVHELPRAAEEIARREARILAVARGPDCTAEKLIATFAQLDSGH